MSRVEIVLLIAAFLVPIIALVIVLPGKIKAKKTEAKKAKEDALKTEEYKPEEKAIEAETTSQKEVKTPTKFNSKVINDASFKNYLNNKRSKLEAPNRLSDNARFDITHDYFKPKQVESQKEYSSIAEEINALSPEVKTLLFSGALDKKHFE